MSIESGPPAVQQKSPDGRNAGDVQDAIDRIFAEYALLFAAQFRKSFPSPEHVLAVKKLWYGFFRRHNAQILLQAARESARETKFLPNHHEVGRHCARLLGLPETEHAWQEACNAAPPWELWRWSHPAVYHAVRLCGNALQEESRGLAFSVFRRHYEEQCRKVLEGAVLRMPKILPEPEENSLPRREAKQRLADIRRKLEL